MNVLLISQCDKRALTETRRILDQFAERLGDRTWQTAITQDGLDTLRRLLRKTARKNSAVACHWIRGRDHSELLWIVGDAKRFNAEGAVPTNTTTGNILRRQDENNWHRAEDVRLLARLAGLLHDLGKASIAFQQRLAGDRTERNLIRHEWVSLRLFQAFVGSDDDGAWLRRMADVDREDSDDWLAPGRYLRDGIDRCDSKPFSNLPPVAAAVGWLVVSHHRLPAAPPRETAEGRAWWSMRPGRFEEAWLRDPLAHVTHRWNELGEDVPGSAFLPYWQLAGTLPVRDAEWRKQAARCARGLLGSLKAHDRADDWTGNAHLMHLARLCLMLADHDYSKLGVTSRAGGVSDGGPVEARRPFVRDGQLLHANTRRDRHSGRTVPNQSLLEHLLGVGHAASLVARALPGFERHLPRLANHRGLRKRSADPRFSWQDKAFDAAQAIREATMERGAFVVNMASTGCGKTLANARILYALADPRQGMRASYALGLRTLTLQTGRSYRDDLHLGEDELAVLVGGLASRALFEHAEAQAAASGSASSQSLIEEDSHVLYEGRTVEHPLLSRALADPEIRKLLSAPMLVCTVDHLAPATESIRAGRQIAPMLRLMSADLVLDELDDYDLDDAPALTRLVHWAGLLGARIVLSSATLPPALVQGMFLAYRAGRIGFQRNRGASGAGETSIDIPCLWVDEFVVKSAACGSDATAGDFGGAHHEFVERRVSRLRSSEVEALRRASILPVAIGARHRGREIQVLGKAVRDAILALHGAHAQTDPVSGKRISFGLVRMANIDPLMDVALALFALGAPGSVRIHLCVYHARFPLLQRSAIEQRLDRTFDRRTPEAVYRLPDVRAAIDAHAEVEQVFVVLASPVCEVGRDWDADWAVAEPSSMRALIQLAGRVQRHRRKAPGSANLAVLDQNLKALLGNRLAFVKPGFERDDGRFRLHSHRLGELLTEDERGLIDAAPRIRPRPAAERQPNRNLVDLEHARLEASLLPRLLADGSAQTGGVLEHLGRDEAAPAWQFPQASLTAVLPIHQPFREDPRPDVELVFRPDEDREQLVPHLVEDPARPSGETLYVSRPDLLHRIVVEPSLGISPWCAFDMPDLMALLMEHADALDMPLKRAADRFMGVQVPPMTESRQGWDWHPWLGFRPRR
ncbi:MAG: type I-F CRISPR-associated helicase Cas3f [Xanthomonadaceae bacterium]|nr:type I-F CRISPR-associated helicase Cas3f [Xanthomonadaceae bacterium]